MLSRKVTLPLVLAGAASAPYLVLEDGWKTITETAQSAYSAVISDESAQPAPDGVRFPGTGPADGNLSAASGQRPPQPGGSFDPLVGAPVTDLGEIIRFDVSPSWVTNRWPRITTTQSEAGMEGLRVPVVTGTNVDDVAGSLTYYFDPYQQLQRLSLEGLTGDERKLVAFVAQYYGLQREPSLNAAMYVSRWNGMPSSVLRITRPPVISADAPHARLQVSLELNRPNIHYGLSPTFLEIINRDRQALRW
jgi:hypothetical protein